MKKYIIIAIASLSLCSCVSENRRERDDVEIIVSPTPTAYSVRTIDYQIEGMHYKVFFTGNGGVHVVNITLDRKLCE